MVLDDDLRIPARSEERGAVTDRPWGETLAAFAREGRSGQLVVQTATGLFQLALSRGVVVGARSPFAADAVARIALAAHWISPITARALGKTEDLGRIARVCELDHGRVRELEHLVLRQRAARTFTIEAGTYAIEDRLTVPTTTRGGVDLRAVIYEGNRLHLDAARLTAALRGLGGQFVLRHSALDELTPFGFGTIELQVLDALREGTSLPALEASDRGLDPRLAEAVLCTLAQCGAVIALETTSTTASIARAPTPRLPTVSRVPTPRSPTVSRVPTPRSPTTTGLSSGPYATAELACVPMLIRADPTVSGGLPDAPVSTRRPSRTTARAGSGPRPLAPPRRTSPPPATPRTPTRAMTDPFLEVQPTTMRSPGLTRDDVIRLIEVGAQLLEQGVDHFTFLGVPFGAGAVKLREAYLEFARYLRPERLEELGIVDESFDASLVFAQVNIAFTVLTDPPRRAEYVATLRPQAAPP